MQLQSARENIRSSILRAVSPRSAHPSDLHLGRHFRAAEQPRHAGKEPLQLQDIKTDADDLIVMVENLLSVTRIQDGTTP